MNSLLARSAHVRGFGLVAALSATALIAGVAAQGQKPGQARTSASMQDEETVPFNEVCPNAWDDSTASDYCTGATVQRIGASTEGDAGHCTITGASCSLTINHGVGNFATTETLSYAMGSTALTASPSDTENCDLCISSSGGSYRMTLRTICNFNEYTSDQATTGILPSP